jgi:hypothetical protein
MCVCIPCVYRKSDNITEISSGKFWECCNFNCDKSNGLICGGEKIIRNGHRIWSLWVCCSIWRVVIESAVKGQHLGSVHPFLNSFSLLLLVFTFTSMLWLFLSFFRNDIFICRKWCLQVSCVSATPSTLAVHLTVLWILVHAWYQLDRSAMARAPVSAVSVSVRTEVSRACLWHVSDFLGVLLNISKLLLIAWNIIYCLLT